MRIGVGAEPARSRDVVLFDGLRLALDGIAWADSDTGEIAVIRYTNHVAKIINRLERDGGEEAPYYEIRKGAVEIHRREDDGTMVVYRGAKP